MQLPGGGVQLPPESNCPDDFDPIRTAKLWAARYPHVVYWLLVGVSFAVEMFALAAVAESVLPFGALITLPFAFLPLALFGLAVDRTKKFIEQRRLIVGRWAAGRWQIEFTPDGTLLLNDALYCEYTLYANLELAVSSEKVGAVLGERVISLDESELVVLLDGVVRRLTRSG